MNAVRRRLALLVFVFGLACAVPMAVSPNWGWLPSLVIAELLHHGVRKGDPCAPLVLPVRPSEEPFRRLHLQLTTRTPSMLASRMLTTQVQGRACLTNHPRIRSIAS